jgi:hypothetical protein
MFQEGDSSGVTTFVEWGVAIRYQQITAQYVWTLFLKTQGRSAKRRPAAAADRKTRR